jgi:hypothetical protein
MVEAEFFGMSNWLQILRESSATLQQYKSEYCDRNDDIHLTAIHGVPPLLAPSQNDGVGFHLPQPGAGLKLSLSRGPQQ